MPAISLIMTEPAPKEIIGELVCNSSEKKGTAPLNEKTQQKKGTIEKTKRGRGAEDDGIQYDPSMRIRILFFLFYSSVACITPFLPMYLDSKAGLKSETLGMLQSIGPVVTMFAGPCWGRLADRTGRQRDFLLATYAMSVLSFLSLPIAGDNVCLLALIKLAAAFFYAPVKSLLDCVVISSLPQNDTSKYARLRLWGQVGTGISSTLMISAVNKSTMGFDLIFVVHALVSLPAAGCILLFNPTANAKNVKRESKVSDDTHGIAPITFKEEMKLLLQGGRVLVFLFLVLACGFSLGFMETFTYVNVRQSYSAANSKDILGRDLGICRICLSMGGVSMYWLSGDIKKLLGSERVMFLSVLSLALCFALYANVTGEEINDMTRICLFCGEMLRGAMFAAFWSTATVYAHQISPPGMTSTVLTLTQSLFRGVGHTSGSFLGGQLVSYFGGIASAYSHTGQVLLSIMIVAALYDRGTSKYSPKAKQM